MPAQIKKRLTIAAPIENVWAALADPESMGAWMDDSSVKMTLRRGGRYAFFGGATSGKFIAITKPVSLEYTWRQHEWKEEWADSVVRWELKAMGESTEVRLTHRKLPNKGERDGHAEGWDAYWLKPMKAWLERPG